MPSSNNKGSFDVFQEARDLVYERKRVAAANMLQHTRSSSRRLTWADERFVLTGDERWGDEPDLLFVEEAPTDSGDLHVHLCICYSFITSPYQARLTLCMGKDIKPGARSKLHPQETQKCKHLQSWLANAVNAFLAAHTRPSVRALRSASMTTSQAVTATFKLICTQVDVAAVASFQPRLRMMLAGTSRAPLTAPPVQMTSQRRLLS
jgi:hypothetical protein